MALTSIHKMAWATLLFTGVLALVKSHTFFWPVVYVYVICMRLFLLGREKIIQWLIEKGADLSLKDEKGRTARDLAVACGMFNKLI